MIETLATIGGFAAFLAIVIGLVFIPYCLSGEDGRENYAAAVGWFIVGLIGGLIGLNYGQAVPLIVYLVAVPAYFVIGFLWFLWKWRQLIVSKLATVRAEYDRYVAQIKEGEIKAWKEWTVYARPEASRYKEQITGWIVLWPWGVAWTVLKWPWRLAERITVWARGIADRMVDRLWNVA